MTVVLIGHAGAYYVDDPCRRCEFLNVCLCRSEDGYAPVPDGDQDQGDELYVAGGVW